MNRGGFRLLASSPHIESQFRLTFFFSVFCLAWNPRYSPFLPHRRAPVGPSALKMYQSRAAPVFYIGSRTWNLKGVVKNKLAETLAMTSEKISRHLESVRFSGTENINIEC